jgi:hypothetical protein
MEIIKYPIVAVLINLHGGSTDYYDDLSFRCQTIDDTKE